MKGGKRPLGYTIIEVMIVLAVSGVMFVIAANFISGKQQRTAFTEGSNEFAAQIQSVITQVTDGQYSDIPFGCTATASPADLTLSPSGVRGDSPTCVFLGKFMHFRLAPNGTTTPDPAKYEVYTLVGARQATNLSAALVTPVVISGGVDLTSQVTVPQALDVKSVTVTNSTSTFPAYGIGFIQGQGVANGAGYNPGAQTVNMVYAISLNDGADHPTATSNLTHNVATSPIDIAKSAEICLSDNTHYAKIMLGDGTQANRLSVKVQVVPNC